jgi:negative regulator of flagellin synthesis FlgM
MKIGHSADKPLPTPAVGTPAVPAEAAKTGAVHATVALSNTASTLLSAGGASEFDADKVARISSAIADGSFKINPEAIADRLIANAQELLSKVRG